MGDDVKSSCSLLRPGLPTYYNGANRGSNAARRSKSRKMRPRFRLQAATRLHEVASNRGSNAAVNTFRALHIPPVKPRKSGRPEVCELTTRGQPKVGSMIGVKSQ